MKILLKQDVVGVGMAGDIKEVANGYARNYLIPEGLAIPANKGAEKQAAQIKETADRQRDRERQAAMSVADKLAELSLNFSARAAETDRLFGSITASDIAIAVEQASGEEIDKRQIMLDQPLRQLGTHQVPIRLMADVIPEVTVIVEREGGEIETGEYEEAEEIPPLIEAAVEVVEELEEQREEQIEVEPEA
ncbi:MAG: 50S ribosomal protein L9 [Chloroflexota bacterium]|nr:50S ribosomal protein L9 [Chloroflexota bacterium]